MQHNHPRRIVAEVRNLVQSARHAAATTVNTLQVLTNFEIGRRIMEYEQKGEKRAAYGAELLKELSSRLTDEFGKGFSVTSLQLMRKFFVENQVRIQQKPSAKLLSSELGQTETGLLPLIQIPRTLSGQSEKLPFTLSWSHYVLLLTIKNSEERSFYEIEATNEGWSLPELKRQVASCLYERLALSKDKEEVRRLARENDFSNWFPWISRNKIMGVKNPGIYVLAISGKDIANKPFSWRDEIVYIGMTNSSAGLKGRLQQFDNTINGKTGHGGADRVRFKYEDYEELVSRLFVSVIPVPCDVKSNHPNDLLKMGEVAKLEYVCFAEYTNKFGHLPQFNDKKYSPKFSLTKGRQHK